jgi:hypothetical protein
MGRSRERSYETLEEVPGLSKLILRAPGTAVDTHEGIRLPSVSPLVVRYLAASVGEALWLNHLALAALLLSARRYEPSSVYGLISILHRRFSQIAASDQAPKRLRSMRGWTWNLTAWMQQYLRGELCDDTATTRSEFWRGYQAVARVEERWMTGLATTALRARYRPFTLPMANEFILQPLVQARELVQEQRRKRKEETDALMPLYPQLRSEAHMRFNRFSRLRQAYQEACRKLEQFETSYPYHFAYVDDGRRYHCCIWDCASFLAQISVEQRSQMGGSPPNRFLELQRIEDASNGLTLPLDEEVWFAPLLRYVLPYTTMANLPSASVEWLTSWGYARTALRTSSCGVTYWRNSTFMRAAQGCVQGLLVPVDELYATLSFGLLALDLFTTTGARLNEVMQPYVFQLYGKQLSAPTISVCLRVLVHGVGRWLHQKGLDTTMYYSEVTETMAADAADSFLARLASHIDVDRAIARSPAELLQIYRDAETRSGTLASVPGGSCTSHGFCKVHFTCIGCPAKVPDPTKRGQVLQKVDWAQRQIEYYRREGLTAEVHSLEQLLRAAAEELKEMDDIERYRRDEQGYHHGDDRCRIPEQPLDGLSRRTSSAGNAPSILRGRLSTSLSKGASRYRSRPLKRRRAKLIPTVAG